MASINTSMLIVADTLSCIQHTEVYGFEEASRAKCHSTILTIPNPKQHVSITKVSTSGKDY